MVYSWGMERDIDPQRLVVLFQRIESLKNRALKRKPPESSGWLMGFVEGFAEGSAAAGLEGEPELPPPLGLSAPSGQLWESARRRAWEAAWKLLLEEGYDFGVHLCGHAEEALANPDGLGSEGTMELAYAHEEGLMVGFVLGKHHRPGPNPQSGG